MEVSTLIDDVASQKKFPVPTEGKHTHSHTHTHTQRVSSICERKQTHIHEKEFKRVLNVRVRTEKHTDR